MYVYIYIYMYICRRTISYKCSPLLMITEAPSYLFKTYRQQAPASIPLVTSHDSLRGVSEN